MFIAMNPSHRTKMGRSGPWLASLSLWQAQYSALSFSTCVVRITYQPCTATTNQTNRMAVSQYGFSTPSLLLLASKTGKDWASSNIVARNCVILAIYIKCTSVVDSVSWKSRGNVLPSPTQMPLVLPDTPTAERVHIAAGQSSCEGDCTVIDLTR